MNKPRKNKLTEEQLREISIKIWNTSKPKKVEKEIQPEEIRVEYLTKAQDKRNRKNNNRVNSFK